VDRRITTTRLRCHGDLQLPRVLFTGKDFVFVDFEGAPGPSLSERRTKRSPLRDIVSMFRSFHYAAHTSLFGHGKGRATPQAVVRPEDLARLEPWTRFWTAWASAEFLRGYLETAGEASFIPKSPDEMKVLLDAFFLERTLWELAHELHHRPTWAGVPLLAILEALGVPPHSPAQQPAVQPQETPQPESVVA